VCSWEDFNLDILNEYIVSDHDFKDICGSYKILENSQIPPSFLAKYWFLIALAATILILLLITFILIRKIRKLKIEVKQAENNFSQMNENEI
jgi:hypothetical protein